MSIHERRSRSHARRLLTPPPKARATTEVDSAETPLADADRLIASFRMRAYSEARRRQRQAVSSEAAAHWSQVSNLIARAGERRVDASPMGTESRDEAAFGGRASGAPPAGRFFDADPLEELERLLAVRPRRFRLQFFGAGTNHGPAVLTETEMQASDASGAIRKAAEVDWPPRAVGLRLLDLEGREIFERLKADLR